MKRWLYWLAGGGAWLVGFGGGALLHGRVYGSYVGFGTLTLWLVGLAFSAAARGRGDTFVGLLVGLLALVVVTESQHLPRPVENLVAPLCMLLAVWVAHEERRGFPLLLLVVLPLGLASAGQLMLAGAAHAGGAWRSLAGLGLGLTLATLVAKTVKDRWRAE